MKHGKLNEIRGFDLAYPASGEVVELRGLRSLRGHLTEKKGRVVILIPSLGGKEQAGSAEGSDGARRK